MHVIAGTSISIIAAVAIVGGSALAAIALSQTKPFQDFAAQPDSGVIRAAMSKLTTVVEQLPPVVLNVAHEVGLHSISDTQSSASGWHCLLLMCKLYHVRFLGGA